MAFWTLTAPDLQLPRSLYEAQIKRLKSQSQAMLQDMDKSDEKKRKEANRQLQAAESLRQEQIRQQTQVALVSEMLNKDKETWLMGADKEDRKRTMAAVVQYCIMPRVLASTADARFCSLFIEMCYNRNVTYFNVPMLSEMIHRGLASTLASCTSNEASRLGIFYREFMKFIYQFDDPAVYEKKAKNSPLFGTDLINPSKGSISYEDFKVFITRWNKVTTKVIRLSWLPCCPALIRLPSPALLQTITERLLSDVRLAEAGVAAHPCACCRSKWS